MTTFVRLMQRTGPVIRPQWAWGDEFWKTARHLAAAHWMESFYSAGNLPRAVPLIDRLNLQSWD
jgi:hypothetical protein